MVLLAFTVIVLFFGDFSIATTQSDRLIEICEFTWNKKTLNCLIVTSENESWWQPYLVNMTFKAIEQWNQAIDFFSTKHPDYRYLSELNIFASVSTVAKAGFDIYISFNKSLSIGSAEALGLAKLVPYGNGTIKNAYITLSSESEVTDLTHRDYRDVTTHELGHVLGLGHSDYADDLMYPYYDLFSSDFGISTLDLYGVAINFSWLDPQRENQTNHRTYSLPPTIEYEYAPILNPVPATALDFPIVRAILVIIISPGLLFIYSVDFVLFALLAIDTIRTKKGKKPLRRQIIDAC